MVNVHARYLDLLENEGWLDRALEFLPTDKQLAERQSAGPGLRAPEFAVMIAYTKNANVTEMLKTDLPDDPVLHADLVDYFPTPLRDRFRDEILSHRLRREIATTQLVNQMVNLSGISYDHRMTEDTGASVDRRGARLARGARGARLPGVVGRDRRDRRDVRSTTRSSCSSTAAATAERVLAVVPAAPAAAGRHRRRDRPLPRAGAGARRAARRLPAGPIARRGARDGEGARRRRACPWRWRSRSAVWRLLHTTFDVIEVAERQGGRSPLVAASPTGSCSTASSCCGCGTGSARCRASDRWQTQARAAFRDDLLTALAELTENVLDTPSRPSAPGGRPTGARRTGDVATHPDPPRRQLRHHQHHRSPCASCATSPSPSVQTSCQPGAYTTVATGLTRSA